MRAILTPRCCDRSWAAGSAAWPARCGTSRERREARPRVSPTRRDRERASRPWRSARRQSATGRDSAERAYGPVQITLPLLPPGAPAAGTASLGSCSEPPNRSFLGRLDRLRSGNRCDFLTVVPPRGGFLNCSPIVSASRHGPRPSGEQQSGGDASMVVPPEPDGSNSRVPGPRRSTIGFATDACTKNEHRLRGYASTPAKAGVQYRWLILGCADRLPRHRARVRRRGRRPNSRSRRRTVRCRSICLCPWPW